MKLPTDSVEGSSPELECPAGNPLGEAATR